MKFNRLENIISVLCVISLLLLFRIFPIAMRAQETAGLSPVIQTADSLQNIADKYMEENNIPAAVEHQNRAIQIIESSLGKNNSTYLKALLNLAILKYNDLDYNQTIALCKEGIELVQELEGEEIDEILITLYLVAGEVNYELRNFPIALENYQKSLEICEKYSESDIIDNITLLLCIAYSYRELNEYEKGIDTITKGLKLYDDYNIEPDMKFAELLEAKGDLNSRNSYYDQAISCYLEALNLAEKLEGKTNPTYVLALNSLLNCYRDTGKYDEAIALADELLKYTQEVYGRNSEKYIKAITTIMGIYEQTGNYPEGIRLGEMALEIMKEANLQNSSEYGQTLNFLGAVHYGIGNYTEALKLAFLTLKSREEILGTESIEYAEALNNLGIYHYATYQYPEAIDFTKSALKLFEKIKGKNNPGYFTALTNLALYNYSAGNLEEATKYIKESLQLVEEIYGTENLHYVQNLSLLASIFDNQGNLEEAINYNEEAVEILRRIIGVPNPQYISTLKDLAYQYLLTNQREKSQETVIEVTNSISDFIKSNFSRLTAAERKSFWDKNKIWFDYVQTYTLIFMNRPSVENGYNALLTSKGLLLDNEREFSKLIKESENPEIISLFEEWSLLNSQIDAARESSLGIQKVQLDSMLNLSQKLERQLIDKSKDFGEYTRNMSITWEDVKNNLKENDVAIEFVTMPYATDSLGYAAYVLSPKRQGPGYAPLFERDQLKKIRPSQYYTTDTLSKLIWKPLDIYLKEAENIYFSPEGELYNIAIEYLPDYEGTGRMNDKYNIHRLSSTRQLAIPSYKDSLKNATLYGGLQYNAGTEVLVRDAEKYPDKNLRDIEIDWEVDDLGLRNGVANLPGTLSEVENIASSLTQKHIYSLIFTDTIGTETSFKNLSGHPIDVLHVATHGFYWPESKSQKKLSFPGMSNPETFNAEELALNRSGLLFAGANNILKGNELPEGTDDGILTAREITTLDFRYVDLVVLSACQTALGEIQGDGVFGLQRGFKKAGVKSLMMSLWKVDDKATGMLMSNFYENLLAGLGKHEALRKAQQSLRDYEFPENSGRHPYDNPRYWAAFILLDAL